MLIIIYYIIKIIKEVCDYYLQFNINNICKFDIICVVADVEMNANNGSFILIILITFINILNINIKVRERVIYYFSYIM